MKIKFLKNIFLILLIVFVIPQYFNVVFAADTNTSALEEGTYIIKSALNENYVFDIQGSNKENGGNLELWTNNKTSNQKFVVKALSNGIYSISAVHSGKYIDVAGSGKTNGTNVAQWQYHGGANQQWIIKDAGNGYYNIISKCNGLYLDIPRSQAKNGANIHMWTKNNSKNQLFKFEKQETTVTVKGEKTIDNGTYVIKTALNENYVFNIQNSSKVNGGNLELGTNNQANNQRFVVKYLNNGTYSISVVHSEKYLDVSGSGKTNGTNVAQWQYHGGENQQWIIKDAGNGYYNIISKVNGLYLDIPRSEAKNGANVHVWTKNNSKNQLFKFEKVTITTSGTKTINNGTYYIKCASNSKVLDVNRSSMDNDGNVGFWTNGATANQKFSVTYLENGYYTLVAQHSGKSVKTSNTNVVQGTKSGNDNEQWVIKDAGNGYYNIISKLNGSYLKQTSSGNAEVGRSDNSNSQKFTFEKPVAIKGTQTIQNGTYLIKSALNNNFVFDIPGSSKDDNVAAKLWTNGSTANQKFSVTYNGNGYYTIKAQHSGKALEVAGASKQLYTNVQQKTSNSSDEQQWIIKDAGNGYYNIISKRSELCIGAESAKNGVNLQMQNLSDSNSVKFKFVVPTPLKGSQTIADGTYIIASALDKKLVLDIPHSSKDDGERLEIWTNGLTSNQKFNVKHVGNGYYTITAVHSGKAIEVAGGNKKLNAAVQQKTLNSSDEQKWIIKDAGNGYYNIISKCSELCMDVTSSKAVNGTKIQTYTCTNSDAQKFRFCNPNIIINLDESKYPGYIAAIEKLQAAHPNWSFEFLYTGLKFSNAVSGESKVHSRNLVETTYSGEWICSTCGTKLYDSGWYCASEKAIAYYLDPRNFLDEENIFQFLDVNAYDSNSCTLDGIKQKVKGTFLENYANDINTACKKTNVNPYYIIARVLQEQGTKGTTIGKGMNGGDGKTYYNPFNIGATGNGESEIYKNALAKAKSSGWDSMEKALEGGIYFCKVNWLENYQNTLYQNKFDIDSQNGTNLYEHQYMQNLMGAYSEARTLRSMYYNTGKINSKFTFIIPLYENMSSTKSAKPSNSIEIYPMNVQVTGTDVRLRAEANDSSKILKTLSKGTVLLSIQRGINSNWQMVVTTDGTIGYVSGTYLKQIDDVKKCNYTRTVKTNDGTGCNIRYGPGLSAPKIKALADGTSVTVIDDSTYKNIDGYNWYRIVLSDGRQAFMPGNYLK